MPDSDGNPTLEEVQAEMDADADYWASQPIQGNPSFPATSPGGNFPGDDD